MKVPPPPNLTGGIHGVQNPPVKFGGVQAEQVHTLPYGGGNPGANLKSISHRFYLLEVAFEWELTKETISLPLGCLQVGYGGVRKFRCLKHPMVA